MKWLARFRLLALATGSAFVLAWRPPQVAELVDGVRSPWRWVAEAGPDAAVSTLAGALLWLVGLWVALAVAVATSTLLPGRFGSLGSSVAGRLTPAALRRLVAAATSTSILLSPAAALANPLGSDSPAGTSSVLPAIGWPTDPAPSASHATALPRAGSSAAPGTAPGNGGVASPTAGGRVRVRAGDSLWSIAGSRLGPAAPAARIRRDWPRWYAANRRLIGPDPNLIRPGMSLRVPAGGLLAPGTAATDTGR